MEARRYGKVKFLYVKELYSEGRDFTLLWKNRTSEEMEKVIEKTADRIMKYDLDVPTMLFFESIKPVAPIGGRLGGAAFAWLIPFIGHGVDDYFVVFRERDNIDILLRLIEEKVEEKKNLSKAKADKETVPKRKWRFWSL